MPLSLTQILAATDLSAPAGHAVERAALLAQRHGARLRLVHVSPPAPMARLAQLISAGALPPDLAPRLRDSTQARLQALASQHSTQHGVQADAHALVGELLPTLQAEADALHCSLIVLGGQGENTLRHLLLGSTAERLLSGATRPMLVVRQAPRAAYQCVLVAVDLSPASLRAIELARTVAPGARLCLLHAFDLPFEGSLRYAGVSEDEITRYRLDAQAQAEGQLDALAASAGLAPHEALTVVRHGDAALRIAEQAQAFGADLIVAGKHADRVLERLFLGSVTRRVLADTQVDVLVSV